MLVIKCVAVMMRSTLTVPLYRYAAFYIFVFCGIGCFYHPLGTDKSSWETPKQKEDKKDSERQQVVRQEMLDNDAYKTQRNTNKNTKRCRHNALRLLLAQTHRYRQTHRHTQIHRGMTALWQAMDDYLVALGPFSSDLAEWLQIWAKPLCKWGSL